MCCILAAVNSTKQPWPVPAPGFDVIGFTTTSDTYYGYEIVVVNGTAIVNIAGSGLLGQSGDYCISAYGDLDENTINGEFGYTSNAATCNTTISIAGTMTTNRPIQDLSPGNF